MKRILCLLLSTAMLTCFFSCSNDTSTNDVRGEVKLPEDDAGKTTGDATEPVEDTVEFSMGKSSGGVYTNDFLGLSFTAPEGWVFYSDEQILELNSITEEFYDEDVLDLIQNAQIVYDMFASSADDLRNVNVNMEKLNALQLVGFNMKNTLESQIDILKSTYENMGYTDVDAKYQKITVDGKEVDALVLNAEIYGIDTNVVVFCFLKGSYMANVSVVSLNSGFDDILECFEIK